MAAHTQHSSDSPGPKSTDTEHINMKAVSANSPDGEDMACLRPFVDAT